MKGWPDAKGSGLPQVRLHNRAFPESVTLEFSMREMVLLGDEAVALGAVHAGLTAAYAYPGTPSTEILEYLVRYQQRHERPLASWCANEKTAYEAALGVSFAGRRTLVAMKHVGLNVAADPFMNSALVSINGGLVVAVADDPGMHSSQNEQDSRYFADFARIAAFEPASHQEAYAMTREAFDVSERFKIPVMIRLVTRLAHSRGNVTLGDPLPEKPPTRVSDPASWILLPSNARRQWRSLLERQADLQAYTAASPYNTVTKGDASRAFGVITTGLGRNYYLENLQDLGPAPPHLHIGAYPWPTETIRAFVSALERVLVLEEGYPLLERSLHGIVPPALDIQGRLSGHVPPDGELNPDIVRAALGLPTRQGLTLRVLQLPNRPPQLCAGCPHTDSFHAVTSALAGFSGAVVTSDIGCYTLGALPPYNLIHSCVCMGASVGMAKGAADAGVHPVAAIIGDSTFLHSGMTPLLDAVTANTPMTLLILDNKTVGMTGGQPTIRPSSELEGLVRGLGVPEAHLHVLEAHPRRAAENAEVVRRAMEHQGLSVVIAVRECIETAKRSKKEKSAARQESGA